MKFLVFLALGACYNARYPITPNVAERDTFEVVSSQLSGTAWAVDPYNFVTAGHVCEWGDQEVVLVHGARRIPVVRVAWNFEMQPCGADVCLLHSDYPLATGLVLAKEMPKAGTAVCYVGYPQGEYTEACGHYLGDNQTDFPTDHGASGSPVFSQDGVFGVLVSARPGHAITDGFVVANLSQIQGLIADLPVSPDFSPNTKGLYRDF